MTVLTPRLPTPAFGAGEAAEPEAINLKPLALPSKLDYCADEVETEPGSCCSALLESSGGSDLEGSAPGDADDLEAEIRCTTVLSLEDESEEADECDDIGPDLRERAGKPRARPTGCPVDPCRIVLSFAYRRITTPRSLTLPPIPEDWPTFVPMLAPRTPWWKRFFCCVCGFEEASQDIETEATGSMLRSVSTETLAAMNASADMHSDYHSLL
jgi:hypothetical protein